MQDNYLYSMKYLIKYGRSSLKGKSLPSQGFTLIELMIVFLMMGIITAVAIPVFYGQIGKSREAEVQMILGGMARSQQSYHFLNGKFALTMVEIEGDSGKVSTKYHDLDNITGNDDMVKIQAVPFNSGQDQVRNYAIGVYFDNGAFYRATCQGHLIGTPVQVGDSPNDPCSDNGYKIE